MRIFIVKILTSNLRVFNNLRCFMKKLFIREKKRAISPIVIRAISRLNKYKDTRKEVSTLWDGKIITKNLSITS